MFHSARIKLTLWYLLIIMTISLSFSAFIYRGVSREFQRRLNVIERRFQVESPPRGWRMHGPVHDYFIADLEQARTRVLVILFYANGAILVLSSAAGYFLAGKTLSPIEKAMEEQKRFVADASHELRTPLTALKTEMEVALRDEKLSLKEAKKVLKSNLEDIDSLKSLASNLLSLAHYQNNGRKLVSQDIDVAEVVRKAYRKILPVAKEKSIKIEIKTKKQIIPADKESLEKMLLIFLDNAVKYTPRNGKVTVSTKTDKRYLYLAIKDTGSGIAQKDIPRIFDRFYRIDQSRSKQKVEGFGLGLSLAKRIIKLHKGSVKVESNLGEETTFTIKFPLLHF